MAAHTQMSAVPITVFELQRDDLVRSESQTRQQQYGAITQAFCGAEVAAINRTLRVRRRYRLGQCRRGGPCGHGWYCSSECGGHLTAILRVAQERAQRINDALQRWRM